jgi:type IV pilus assembly protein PilY1
MVRDVWLDGTGGQPADGRKQWQEYRTVAVVGSGRGGVHRFALDLTRLLGLAAGHTGTLTPNQAGDFLWMWPQPCDPLALKVGESFSNFAPQPPPIGPVALEPTADDFLRIRSGTGTGGVSTPWVINSTPARERWVVALNGGYDPHQARGRGLALVDMQSGHTVWSFFHQDNRGRSQHLRYSFAAGMALADVGNPSNPGADADLLFDTATVGDYGGQLWTVRFWQPGQWDAFTQQVSNWHAARSFRVANLAGRTANPEALRGPFSTIATNVVQPDTGFLRTFVGTGDSQNVLDTGTKCRLGNPRACAEQGCSSQSYLEIRRAGSPVSTSSTSYAGYALMDAFSLQSQSGPSCAGTSVKLTWDNTALNGCWNSHDGSIEYVCGGDPSTWSCQTVADTWVRLNYTHWAAPYPHRFYGIWSYGGDPSRTFNTEPEAAAFDAQMFTDADLVNVGQFDVDGYVIPQTEVDAAPLSKGWYLNYGGANERTGSAATVIDGCILWSSYEPGVGAAAVCSDTHQNVSRLYQANFVSGTASCAQGFYSPVNGTWSRFLPFATVANLGSPAPQLLKYNDELHRQATLSTPFGAVTPVGGMSSGPFMSLPVSEGPP